MGSWIVLLVGCASEPVPATPTDADKAIALTAARLAPHAIVQHPIDASKETWNLERDPRGTWSLTYDYADEHLVVNFTAVREPSAGDADWAHVGFGLGRTFVDGTDGVTLIDAADALTWGDESDCSYIRTSGIDVGYVCRGKKDRLAFMTTVAGVSPIDEGTPAKMLAEPLAALERWKAVR